MRAKLALALLPGLITMILAGPVAAEWFVERVTDTTDDSRHPTATYDRDDDLHLIWEEGNQILHRIRYATGWAEIDTVGTTSSGYDRWTCLL